MNESNNHEKEIDIDAEELLFKANEFQVNHDFDLAIEEYDKALNFYKSQHLTEEIERVNHLIDQCYEQKSEYLTTIPLTTTDEDVGGKREELPEKVKQFEALKLSEESFQLQIAKLVDEAERLDREFDVDMKKSFKEGEIAQNPPYLKMIEIYEEVRELLLNKGWLDKVEIYSKQIELCNDKLNKYEKLSELHEKKAQETTVSIKIYEQTKPEETIKLIKASDRVHKELEEKELENYIAKLVDKAENIAREYELSMKQAIKEGKLVEQCAYPEVIEIYQKCQTILKDQDWVKQAAVYAKQVQIYKEKMEKDKKLRKIEEEKANKQREFEESLKKVETEGIPKEEEKAEKVPTEEDLLKAKIANLVNKAESMAKKYEFALRQGKFEEDCPYEEIIQIYKECKKLLIEKKWMDQARIYSNQIEIYEKKLENDKKLRDIERQKVQKQKEFEESLKLGNIRQIKTSLKPTKDKLSKEEEDFNQQILELIDSAEKLVRDFDSILKRKIKEGKIHTNIEKVDEAIHIYENVIKLMNKKGWVTQSLEFRNQISLLEEKKENVKRLADIEVSKAKREQEISEMLKVHKTDDTKKIQKLEELMLRRKETEKTFESALNLVEKAESLVNEYETNLREGTYDDISPYPRAIEIYSQAIKIFEKAGWEEEAKKLENTRKLYDDKKIKDEKLRTLRAGGVIQDLDSHTFSDLTEDILSKKMIELKEERDRKEKLNLANELLQRLKEVDAKAKKYETAIEEDILKVEANPYEEIIEVYNEVKSEFERIGWREETMRMQESIEYYKRKLEEDLEIRENRKRWREDNKLKERGYTLMEKASAALENRNYDEAESIYTNASRIFESIASTFELEKINNALKTIGDIRKSLAEEERKQKEYEQTKEKEYKQRKQYLLREAEQKRLEAEKLTKQELIERLSKEEKNKKAQEIMEMIEEAEQIVKDYEKQIKNGEIPVECPYNKVIGIYSLAKEKFQAMEWQNYVKSMDETIEHYKFKLEKDNQLRIDIIEGEKQLEIEKEEQEKRIMESIKQAEEIEKKKQLKKARRIEKEQQVQQQKERAFDLIELANLELSNNQFQKVIELYQKAKEIFDNIEWKEGVLTVQDSIELVIEKEKEFQKEQALLKKKEEEQSLYEKYLEDELKRIQAIKKIEEEQKLKQKKEIEKERKAQTEISNKAYYSIEEGVLLVIRKEFQQAREKFNQAKQIFESLEWESETKRISEELIPMLEKEEIREKEILKIRGRRKEEEKLLQEYLKKVDLEKAERKERKKQKRAQVVKKRYKEKLKIAQTLIDDYRYNEALIALSKERVKLERSNKVDELDEINSMIKIIEEKSEVPLVTSISFKHIQENSHFVNAYKAIDDAHISIKDNNIMRAISLLNEALFHFFELEVDGVLTRNIENKINSLKLQIQDEKRVKIPKISERKEDKGKSILEEIARRRKERRNKLKKL